MMFGFFKKVVGAVGKVVGVATKVGAMVPGLGFPAAVARLGGKILVATSKVGSAAKQAESVLMARGVQLPSYVSAGAEAKASAVMPGGATLTSNAATTGSAPSGKGRGPTRKKSKRKTRRGGKRKRRRGRRGLTAKQLAAGFGGKRRMRGRR